MKLMNALVAPPPPPSSSSERIIASSSNDPLASEQASKKRKIDVHDPTISTEERRFRILELQKEEYRERSVADTTLHYVEPAYVGKFEPFWMPLYERLVIGARTRLCDSSLTDEELEWLRKEIRFDYCHFVWCHKYAQPRLCRRIPPCQPIERNEELQFFDTPNAQFFDEKHGDCLCTTEDAIVLCNDLSHQHSKNGWATQIATTHRDPAALFSFQRSVGSIDRYRDRLLCGSYNQNIVAARVFGPGSNQRWETMLDVASSLPEIQHSASLFNKLDEVLRRDENLSELRHCIWTFSYSSSKKEHPGDRKMSLPPKTIHYLKSRSRRGEHCEPRTVSDAGYLDAGHPIHWRFDAREAAETTLGLALFVEATKNSNWLNVWNHWFRIVVQHCSNCRECRRRFVEFLSCVLLLEQLTLGVFTLDFRVRLERFLCALKTL